MGFRTHSKGKYAVTSTSTNRGFDGNTNEGVSNSGNPCLGIRSRTNQDILSKSSVDGIRNQQIPATSNPIHSSTWDDDKMRPAVTAKKVVKGFGSGSPVLNNFCMNVPQGSIYSLLGSSGCGKTTLLSCVVGLKQIQSGQIHVFGTVPGSKGSGVPGRRVGYMPQDVSLYNDFSITESLRYFGTLYGMKSSDISSNEEFLIKVLNLPNPNRLVGQLSGGQRRRVSLAVSLIHSPDLLILDEPTVGVDPLLRESIWKHLCELVRTRNTTVIITTHYIEEARNSNMIGIMRGGRLLAEKSPTKFIEEHNTEFLENIVLTLCRNDKLGNDRESRSRVVTNRIEDSGDVNENNLQTSPASSHAKGTVEDQNSIGDIGNRIRALILKNATVMRRNYILMLFMVILPTIQITVTCLALGGDPKPLKLGVVNQESNCSGSFLRLEACDLENLSCQFLSKLPNDTIFTSNFETAAAARDAVRKGQLWGFVLFPENFSNHLYTRFSSGNIVDNETLDGSQIYLEMDVSNKQVAVTVKRLIAEGFKDFIRDMLTDCGFNPELGESPLKFQTPIYGTDGTDFKEFLATGSLSAVMVLFPLLSSGISLIWDKKQGTMERVLVAGVNTWEFMTAFLVTDGFILILQQIICFFIVTLGFGINVHGSLVTASAILTLLGVTGLSMGYLVASVCSEEIEAALLSMAIYFPNLLLSGVLWPNEGMPIAVKYFSYIWPGTLPGEAFRSVASRGWNINHPHVWPGFVVCFAWIVACWLGTIFVHKIALKGK